MILRTLILDYETRSEADLKKVGAYEYARHPSTRILCAAWKLDDSPVRLWSPALAGRDWRNLKALLADHTVKVVAHNAFFEQVITKFVFKEDVPIHRWTCTAATAAALALLRKLQEVCEVLGLSAQKDMEGHRLMMKMSKPRKPTKNNPNVWHNSKDDLMRLMEYCKRDVEAEYELYHALPPLNEMERKVWELDQKINWRGFFVDRPLVKTVLKMVAQEIKELDAETARITHGAIATTNKRAALLDYFYAHGVTKKELPDLKALTITHTLKTPQPAFVRRLLEIRQAVSKTSTAKYAAFEARSRSDSRVHDMLVYHAASTGRWGGAGVQPQNFPRGHIKDIDTACEILATGDLELVRLIYGDPMNAFASCLRGMIRATM